MGITILKSNLTYSRENSFIKLEVRSVGSTCFTGYLTADTTLDDSNWLAAQPPTVYGTNDLNLLIGFDHSLHAPVPSPYGLGFSPDSITAPPGPVSAPETFSFQIFTVQLEYDEYSISQITFVQPDEGATPSGTGVGKVPEMLAKPPSDDYGQVARDMAELSHAVRLEIAARIQPVLNAKAQSTEHVTYDQKKVLARWVNEELRHLDLAIKCPKTGEPSILLAMPGHQPEIGRFAIEHKTADGKRVRSFTSPELPHLELMEANPRREALMEWRDRLGPQRGGPNRG